MRTYLIISIFLCLSFACRKGDTYPDYDEIAGKYKLAYIEKWNMAWPSDSIVRIYPADKYEIYFKKESKVNLIKNDDCEKTLKVYQCKSQLLGFPEQYRSFETNIDKKEYRFSLHYYTVSITDTLAGPFYPFDLVSTTDGSSYTCKYAKE